MKNIIIISAIALIVVVSVMLSGDFITGLFTFDDSGRTGDNISEGPAFNVSFGFEKKTEEVTEEPEEIVEEPEEIIVTSGGGSSSGGNSGGSYSPPAEDPSTPPEPANHTFTVLIDARENVRTIEFMIIYPEDGTLTNDPIISGFLTENETVSVKTFIAETNTSILVGAFRDPNTGVNGTGELANITIFTAYPENIIITEAQAGGERVDGIRTPLNAQISGNTIIVTSA